jgi:hypothetical protein
MYPDPSAISFARTLPTAQLPSLRARASLSLVIHEAVLLVHGHGAHPVLLEPLRRALERRGFRAVNWRYRSLRGSIEPHAARLAVTAKEFDDDTGVERLHFVGHSRRPRWR